MAKNLLRSSVFAQVCQLFVRCVFLSFCVFVRTLGQKEHFPFGFNFQWIDVPLLHWCTDYTAVFCTVFELSRYLLLAKVNILKYSNKLFYIVSDLNRNCQPVFTSFACPPSSPVSLSTTRSCCPRHFSVNCSTESAAYQLPLNYYAAVLGITSLLRSRWFPAPQLYLFSSVATLDSATRLRLWLENGTLSQFSAEKPNAVAS